MATEATDILLNAITEGAGGLQTVRECLRNVQNQSELQDLLEWRDDGGYGLVAWTIDRNNADALYEFLKHSSDLGYLYPLSDTKSDNILYMAINHPNTLVLKTVLGCIKHNQIDMENAFELLDGIQNVIHIAAGAGRVELFKECCGISPQDFTTALKIQDDSGQNPLHIASYKGHLEVVKEIAALSHSFLNARTYKGETPLHMAITRSAPNPNRLDIVKFLIGQDSSLIEDCDGQDRSPYMRAETLTKNPRISPSELTILDFLRDQIFRRPDFGYDDMRKLLHGKGG